MLLNEELIREAAINAKYTPLYEGFSLEKSFHFNAQESYDLFVSHSFKDREMIIGLKHLFEKAGYKIYIDWVNDPDLDRNNVDESTAQLLKDRLKACKALVYVSTENTPSSKWCPWELGLGDGMLNKVCILPVMKGSYRGQEYLGLYPYLDYDSYKNRDSKDFWVMDQQDKEKYVLLRKWLDNGAQPYLHT